jgi:hypothetical protein
VVLFAEAIPGASFSRLSVVHEIAAIVGQSGLPTAGNPSGAGFTPQPVTLRSPTFANALRACLRKIPDAMTSWVHGESSSALLIRRRADASPVTLALGEGTVVVSKRILPRHDLQVRGVVINQVYQIEGEEITAAVDSAGFTGGRRILRDTITLNPPRSVGGVTQSVTVLAESYTASSPEFWKKYGGLNNDATDISVTGVSATGSPLGKVFLGGQIPPWMNFDAHCKRGTWTAVLRFKVLLDKEDPSKGFKLEKGSSTISLWTTDLEGLYTDSSSGGGEIPGDEPVTGAAAALYASLSVLQYEGQVTTVQEEVTGSLHPGDRLHLSGGRSEWADMGAQIHRVTWDISAGRTMLDFGPSQHLAPADFAELIRDQSRDFYAPGLPAQAAGSGGSSGSEVEAGTTPATGASAALDSVTEEFKATVNGWELAWKVDTGKFSLKKTEDVAKQFLLDLDASDFADRMRLHITGPNDEEVVIKLRPTKICMIEDGEVVTQDVLLFRSNHVEDLTFE